MDAHYERAIVRAATIDELLSDDFESLPGQKGDADLAARRLAAWCVSCASGDWSLFSRRLSRDGLTIDDVLERFATTRRKASAAPPAWIRDAIWIETALENPAESTEPAVAADRAEACAFEHLLAPVVDKAEALLWSDIDARAADNLNEQAYHCLRHSLLEALSRLAAPAIYERFDQARKASVPPTDAVKPEQDTRTSRYDHFVADMKAGGFRRLFEDKPVLLRLIAVTTRQWIEASREFVLRLDADLASIRGDILHSSARSKVSKIEGDLSDPHNCGRSVKIVSFEDGSRIVYKPKDLQVDVAWHALVERLNRSQSRIELKAACAIARDGYGWTEFIEHAGCAGQESCERFFRRAGAWLALFHCFAATDMHQENMIAAGDHPVPIDLEMILQASDEEQKGQEPEQQAFHAATGILANSVMTVGLLPAYGRSPDNKVFAIGGLTANWNSTTKLKWNDINSDAMRPAKFNDAGATNPNLPHVNGRYAKLGDHVDSFVAGFEDYAKFLFDRSRDANQGGLFDDFAGVAVRKVIHPTRFYYMLLQRLKNHRGMDDGVLWSAQADFIARLAEWEKDVDPVWPLQQAERLALVSLNVPHFVSFSDRSEIRDATGISIRTAAMSGLDRARARVRSFDERELAWQVDVIRENTNAIPRTTGTPERRAELKETLRPAASISARDIFIAEADKIAEELGSRAIRRSSSAAWIGLDWLGDAEVFQLVCLGPELYNGISGIAVFLAAHAAVSGRGSSGELARAGIAHIRKNLRSRNAARIARSLGIGGATGLGSIVYALTVMSRCLNDEDLLLDARVVAELFTDDLIAADKHLDVIGGSAGAILALLRLYRDTRSDDVLNRATKCGEHLLGQRRLGAEGLRSWIGHGLGPRALNGMSHGAAGFAYALTALAAATGRDEFTKAAAECIAFEDSSFSAERKNWPDWRGDGEPGWPCQWCHGATGVGLARIAMARQGGAKVETACKIASKVTSTDVQNALEGVERSWPASLDTLCCGTLGSVEFFCEAASALGRDDLRELASQRLMAVLAEASSAGDYRWNSGKRKFNLGLFRGLAGVGYTLLRQADASLPNILVWE